MLNEPPVTAQEKLEQIVDKNGEIYQVLECLGQGGMGIVLKAHQLRMDRIVALKMLHKSVYHSSAAIERLRNEAKAMVKLSHPNIVRIYSLGMTPQHQPFLVMECVSGKTVTELLNCRGKLDQEVCLPIFKQILSALNCAHQAGFVHRDIKPSNIIVDDNLHAKLMDFGIAKAFIDENIIDLQKQTISGDLLGSPAYMSPEQCRGEKLDVRSDIYSLGCVMFEMLTNSQLFEGSTCLEVMYKHINDLPDLSMLGSETPLEELIGKALAKDPLERYQTAEEFLSALETCIDSLQYPVYKRKNTVSLLSTAILPATTGTTNFNRGRIMLIILIVAIGFCVALFATAMYFNSSELQNIHANNEQPPEFRSLECARDSAETHLIETYNKYMPDNYQKYKDEVIRTTDKLDKAIEIGKQQNEYKAVARATELLGNTLIFTDAARSERYLKNSMLYCEKQYTKESKEYINRLIDLGNLYAFHQKTELAQSYFQQALNISDKMMAEGKISYTALGQTYQHYAAFKTIQGQYQDAEHWAILARKKFKQEFVPDIFAITSNEYDIASIQICQKHFANAIQTASEAINYLKRMDAQQNIGIAQMNEYMDSLFQIYGERILAAHNLNLHSETTACFKSLGKLLEDQRFNNANSVMQYSKYINSTTLYLLSAQDCSDSINLLRLGARQALKHGVIQKDTAAAIEKTLLETIPTQAGSQNQNDAVLCCRRALKIFHQASIAAAGT